MGKISNFITCAAVEKKLRLQSDSVGPSCGVVGVVGGRASGGRGVHCRGPAAGVTSGGAALAASVNSRGVCCLAPSLPVHSCLRLLPYRA